jgi:peptide deformylase
VRGACRRAPTLWRVAVRPIRIVGDPVLHTPTRRVTEFDDALRELVADMFDTMEAADGVGLAANQVGVPLRLFVYDCPDEELGQRRRGVVVNPVIETSERPGGMPDPDEDDEGCLSVPFEQFPTSRADWARVTGTDVDGTPLTVEGSGFFARCLQHETDHLNGTVFGDRLPARARKKLYAAHQEVAEHYPDDWPVTPRTVDDSDSEPEPQME